LWFERSMTLHSNALQYWGFILALDAAAIGWFAAFGESLENSFWLKIVIVSSLAILQGFSMAGVLKIYRLFRPAWSQYKEIVSQNEGSMNYFDSEFMSIFPISDKTILLINGAIFMLAIVALFFNEISGVLSWL